MRKLFVLAALSGACAVAHAADEGWVDGADANGASGWACDSAWPYHQEYVHVYRDDGPFLGAIYAGNVREQAVGDRCGGHSHHGFSGPLNYPSNLIDGKKHNVHFYFIRGDGSHFEIPGSPKKVQFGDPPPPPSPQTIKGCISQPPTPSWVSIEWGAHYNTCYMRWQNLDPASYPYKIGHTVYSCSNNTPPGWVRVGQTIWGSGCHISDSVSGMPKKSSAWILKKL